jgi:CRISPR-associated protein Cas6
MTDPQAQQDAAVDVVFPLGGETLPRDHAQALQLALCAQFPWLSLEALAGVHPVKLVPGNEDPALLSRRARLLLRVGVHRAEELMAVTGIDLDVSGHRLRLGAPHLRELHPHATLYAYKVASESADEVALMATLERELAALGVGGERVCGKRQRMVVWGAAVNTFSLMLHALPPEQSLRLQQHGLGPYRLLGCGVFVPHKSAAAV